VLADVTPPAAADVNGTHAAVFEQPALEHDVVESVEPPVGQYVM
jgi:hypothetical protein